MYLADFTLQSGSSNSPTTGGGKLGLGTLATGTPAPPPASLRNFIFGNLSGWTVPAVGTVMVSGQAALRTSSLAGNAFEGGSAQAVATFLQLRETQSLPVVFS